MAEDDFRERAATGDPERRQGVARNEREGKTVSAPAAPEGMFTVADPALSCGDCTRLKQAQVIMGYIYIITVRISRSKQ